MAKLGTHLVCIFVLVAVVSSLSMAEVYTIPASDIVSVPRDVNGWPRADCMDPYQAVIGYVNDDLGDADAYAQYLIPDTSELAENEVVTSVKLNIQVVQRTGNPAYSCGISFYYVEDDSWVTWGWGSPTGDWWNGGDWQNRPAMTDCIDERAPSDTGGTTNALQSTDISSYLLKDGEGAGQTLSIGFIRWGSLGGAYLGNAGDPATNPYITIETEILEPGLLEGDANRDGVVSAGDYASVQSNFGNTGDPGLLGDANVDGVVSAGDYASVQANFGNTASAIAGTVPEPATLSLLVIGGVAMFRRRRD